MAAAVPKSGEVYYAEDGTVSIVLDDNFDPNYEPPQKEIEEYAKWLGIDPDNEKELLWIARDGLRAPLPKEWKPCKTDTGDVYYFNFKSGESIWDHPMDDVYKKKVEDERSKLKAGGGGGGKPTKLVKGGAGNTAAADAKPMSRTAIEGVRPKSGRLGAIGSTEEQKTQRPDISALLPTKSEQVASTLMGKKKEPLKDMKELERTLRKKFDSELDATRVALQSNYDKQIQELKASLTADQRKASNNLKNDVEDEVEQVKRNGERRNKRELQLYVDSIDKQKEDLRRTLKAAQEKLDADTAGVNRRVESELAEKRSAAEKQLSLDIGRRRQEIQEAWQRERAHVEMQTQQKKNELQSAHELRVEQARQKELQSLSKKAQDFEDQLLSEMAAVKQQLATERAAHSERVSRDAKDASAGAAAAYNLANAEYQAAIAEAQRAADAALAAEKDAANLSTEQLLTSIEQKKADARAQALSLGQKSSEERMAARRAFAATRVREAEADLNSRFEEEKRAYEAETQRLEREAQEQAQRTSALNAQQQQQTSQAALEQVRQAAIAQRNATLSEMEDRHRRLLETVRREVGDAARGANQNPRETTEYRTRLAQEKEAWQRNNPAPVYHLPTLPDVPVFDPSNVTIEPIVVRREVEAAPTSSEIARVVQEEVARRRESIAPEWAHKLSELKRSLSVTFAQERDAHRAKAVSDMEARLSSYRESGGSPLRAAKGRVALANATTQRPPTPKVEASPSQLVSYREADTQTTELRNVLQQRLDELMAALSAEAQSAATDVASLQRELQSVTAAVGHGGGVPPRPHSASAVHHPQQAMNRAQTADAAYFQTAAHPSPTNHGPMYNQQQGPARRSVTPSGGGAMPGSHQSTPSRRPRGSTFQERLAKAHDLLRRKKKEIKGRQQQLEDVRADWKRDMAAAKAARDDDQVRTLKRVAEVLEADARNLNREATALKESYQWLKSEGEGYYCEKHPNPHASSALQQRGTPTTGLQPGAETGDIGALLADIFRKADLVEHQVNRAEVRRPSPGGVGADVMVNKWSTWLRRQPAAGESATTRPSDALPTNIGAEQHMDASPKKRDVERWVTEQQRSFR